MISIENLSKSYGSKIVLETLLSDKKEAKLMAS